jgi:hypothetical protein
LKGSTINSLDLFVSLSPTSRFLFRELESLFGFRPDSGAILSELPVFQTTAQAVFRIIFERKLRPAAKRSPPNAWQWSSRDFRGARDACSGSLAIHESIIRKTFWKNNTTS